LKVLLIEDDDNFAFVIDALLRREANVSVTRVNYLEGAVAALDERSPDVILLDLSLPDASGLATLSRLRQYSGQIPIIVLTGNRDEQSAIEAVRSGAQDYLVKGEFENRGLLRALHYAIERRNNEDKYRELVESIDAIVWAADPVTWRFTFVSKAAEKLLGYPVERWLASSDFWVNLIHPDDRSRAIEYCQRQVEKGDNHEFECRVVALDGRIVWLRNIVQAPLDLDSLWVMGDATRLSQAVGNLLDNAAKCTDRGDEVTVRLTVAKPGDRVNGMGSMGSMGRYGKSGTDWYFPYLPCFPYPTSRRPDRGPGHRRWDRIGDAARVVRDVYAGGPQLRTIPRRAWVRAGPGERPDRTPRRACASRECRDRPGSDLYGFAAPDRGPGSQE